MPKCEIDLVKARLKAASRKLSERKQSHDRRITGEMTSGNVFADLGFDNSEEELRKAKLAREIRAVIIRRRLTQAKRLGCSL
ncbi:XRE family transcriptional regulator [Mesorhizobium sp. NZP2234]|uniref:XRE family transcriptional regulator n=1 Tax=Mesorhizobium sp. NZP2234 TaxID=2483402 RepID=UPI001FF04F09|nr:XRE family transcriptional regulator [Mesorhizobium sp. NZP2234]